MATDASAAIRDPDRLAALRELALLDGVSDEAFDRLTRLASRGLSVPMAFICILDAERQYFLSEHGLAEPWRTQRETPLSHCLCHHALERLAPLVVADARADPLTADSRAIADLGIVAYAEVSLLTSRGVLLGAFAAADVRPRHWSEDDLATLRDLAAAALTEIERQGALRASLRAQEARDRAHQEAQAALRVRDELLASITHDLTNPLTIIQSTVQLLQRRLARDGTLPEHSLDEGLDRISRGASHMTAQIIELVDLVRLHRGDALQLRLSNTDLVALARQLVELYGHTTDLHVITLESDSPALRGSWDTLRLRRALDNLLSNALKYSPAGGTVRVQVARTDRFGKGWAEVTVRDEGIGIPEVDLPHVFERFRRGSNAQGLVSGSGIGLAGAKQIIEQHGGQISIESEERVGTTVTILLPL